MADKTFDHVMTTLVKRDKTTETYKCLVANFFTTVAEITELSQAVLDKLKYDETNEDGNLVKQNIDIPLPFKNRILILITFLGYVRYNNNGSLDETIIMALTEQDFDDFRISKNYVPPSTVTSLSSTSNVASSTSTGPTPTSELASFIKGVKRDISQYPEIKDDRFFENWHRSFLAVAKSHRIDDVFDVNYVPSSPDETMLFEEKQKFAFTVLDAKLRTNMGKTIVRSHSDTGNAQKAWGEFVNDIKSSAKATLSSSQLLEWLAQAKYDKNWRSTSHDFILYWMKQVSDYDSFQPPTGRLLDDVKLTLLQNAVNDVPEFRSVRTTAELINVSSIRSGTPSKLTYNQYLELLSSAAYSFDQKFSRQSVQPKKQHVFSTATTDVSDDADTDYVYDTNEHDDTDEAFFDIDTYQAHLTKRKTPIHGQQQKAFQNNVTPNAPGQYSRPRIESTVWNKLPKAAQDILRAANPSPRLLDPARKVNVMASSEDISPDFDQMHLDIVDAPNIPPDTSSNVLLSHMSNRTLLSPQDIRQAFPLNTGIRKKGEQSQRFSSSDFSNDEITVNGVTYQRKVNATNILYIINNKQLSHGGFALVDRGANGGVIGSDALVLDKTSRTVNIVGIDNHEVTDIPICTGAAYTRTQHGPVIIIMHQYAYLGQGKSIHSSIQMEHFKLQVNDKSSKVPGGTQSIITPDGYILPLDIMDGLPYIKMRPPTDVEYHTLPHVVLTSDTNWDPSVFDRSIDDNDDQFFNDIELLTDYARHPFNEFGEYQYRHVAALAQFDSCPDIMVNNTEDLINDLVHRSIHKLNVTNIEPDYSALQPYFGWMPIEIIKRTFQATTQYARSLHLYDNMRKHYKTRFPALNVSRRSEPVATDTIFSDTPAVDSGATCAQFFVGRDSLVADVYGMKSDKEFVNTLEDNIRFRGAMDMLISDRAKSEISNRVKDLLRALLINEWQSEPHHQHQNYAERRIQIVKGKTNLILNRTGAPPDTWLLCLDYVCNLLNHLATESLGWRTPMQELTGSTSDISKFLQFYFWEPVYYSRVEPGFPSETTEDKGHFVGFGNSVGDAMTFKVLNKETRKVIYRSNVRSAEKEISKLNKRLEDNPNNSDTIFIKSKSEYAEPSGHTPMKILPGFLPSELIGRTFLGLPTEDGERYRLRIVKAICDHQSNIDKHAERVKFLVQGRNKSLEEILSYNDIIDHIQRNNSEEDDVNNQFLKFRAIIAHQGPLSPKDNGYKGSSYNVLIDWEDGECTYEPLDVIAKDDPVTCAIYAKNNDLFDKPGWKRFKRLAKREVKLTRLLNQTRLRSVRRTMRYQYGFLVPNSHADAIELDRINGNTLWQDAEHEEVMLLLEYDTFQDLGKNGIPPSTHQKIRCHMVYAVKHDGRHRARLVAGGHLTPIPLESVYSGVVSLRGLRLVVFLAELNGLTLWNADVGSAYLEARTKEKVYIIAGPEFGELCGHCLIIFKALYGLRSSGQRWHERFADIMRDIGFVPSLADSDIWMRRKNDIYEYVAVYVDDLALAMIDPEEFITILREKYSLKLKGVGPMQFHLGCDFFRDPDNTLCFGPQKYIDKMIGNYVTMFGEKPKGYTSPLEANDHPELDDTDILDDNDIKKYQSMIGELQWAISLGRFDILTAVMSMSQYRVAPRIGHLKRLQRIYGYLKRFKSGAIRIRTDTPDFSAIPDFEHDWSYSVYGNVEELIPADIPTPLGKPVLLSTYKDANLYHNFTTGRAVTGILHFINNTPIDWYSKAQSTVETATYGSEFVAARIAVDQIIDLRTTLRYLGVPIIGKSFLFGDNESVWKNATVPHSSLKKRHNALSYHRVREAIAAKIIGFYKIESKDNPADVLSKHLGYNLAKALLKPLLFWRGDIDTLFRSDDIRTKGEC